MKTAIKQSPNMKRLDNIEHMLKSVSRDAEKVLGERETLADERDKWKARAESAERQLGAVRAALGLNPSELTISNGSDEPSKRLHRRVPREPGAPSLGEPIGGITDEIEQLIANAPGAVKSATSIPKAAFIPDDERAILAALTSNWQTVLQLHRAAVAHGFSKGNQTVRNYMVGKQGGKAGLAEVHANMIETQETPLAWRLKATYSREEEVRA